MKEIKLWKVSPDEKGKHIVEQLTNINQTDTENQLEEVIVRCPELLMRDLKLVGRQTGASGGALDLLGVDGDGRLVVFELKRGTLTRDAVAQIIDYGSYLSELGTDELISHISERSGKLGIEKIDNFNAWYQEQFSKDISTLQEPRMVLVGLGVDDRARRMVSFLAQNEIDISLITFHGFEEAGKVFLARQVEVTAKPLTGTTGITKKDNLEKLQQKVKELGIENYYYKISAFFRNQLSAYEWPNPGGFSYSLSELTESGSESLRNYISLYLASSGKVKIQIYPRALEINSDKFDPIIKKLSGKIKHRTDGGVEIFVSSDQEWEKLLPIFQELCPLILAGWKAKREQQVVEEFKETNREGLFVDDIDLFEVDTKK